MTTREKAEMLRNADPYLSASAIAKACGVSRERVRQILGDRTCAVKVPKPPKVRKRIPKGDVLLKCDECGTIFSRRAARHDRAMRQGYRHIWCSKTCQGKYMGRKRWVGREHIPAAPVNLLTGMRRFARKVLLGA